ncbi:MAG TPA: VOC family protein [Beijerinckiaceae bacterium]|jgi:catechol 2,3-dioxygenase-like lactoylglutathione lyase family enzyme
MPVVSIERMDHIQINVTDLSRARRFYGEVLELEEVPRPESFDFAGAWYRIGAVDLHLVVRAPEPDGDDHFCLWVADVRATAEALEARGEAVAWQQRYKIPGVDRFFIRDPDGNRIEVQGPDGTGRSRWE